MTHKNPEELAEKFCEQESRARFHNMYYLSRFIRSGFYGSDFRPPDSLADTIVLTEEGHKVASSAGQRVNTATDADIRLATLCKFGHDDLLVDLEASDQRGLQKWLDNEIHRHNIGYPWIYDTLLYDKFHDMECRALEELSPEDTDELLNGTPQGVFQISKWVAGPLGMTKSLTVRRVPPRRSVALWHCSDPTCARLHVSKLASQRPHFKQVLSEIKQYFRKRGEEPSNWSRFFWNYLAEGHGYMDDYHPGYLPYFLGYCLSDEELQELLALTINNGGKSLRGNFPDDRPRSGFFERSGADIAEDLDRYASLQLLLLAPDNDIVEAIEQLIGEREIAIPYTEVRRSPYVVGKSGGWLRCIPECSRLGVRFVPRYERTEHAIARLRNVVRKSLTLETTEPLEWLLRKEVGETTSEKLDAYMSATPPSEIVDKACFSSKKALECTFEELEYGHFGFDNIDYSEKTLRDKILWKLGFDVKQYPSRQSNFWRQLGDFSETVEQYQTVDYIDKEEIRSTAINFFISVERILDRTLSFMTWVLLQDHYAETGFECNLQAASRFMSEELSGIVNTDQGPLKYSSGGTNTLYPLIRGFGVLSDICHKTLNEGPPSTKRPPGEMPFFHERTEIARFPFQHKRLIDDLGPSTITRILNVFSGVHQDLTKAKVRDVRNGLSHDKPEQEFPTLGEMDAAIETLKSIVGLLEQGGYTPLVCWHCGANSNEFGRFTHSYKSYSGETTELYSDLRLLLSRVPTPRTEPIIIARDILVPGTNQPVRFVFQEPSDFTRIWKNYPKGKRVQGYQKRTERPAAANPQTAQQGKRNVP